MIIVRRTNERISFRISSVLSKVEPEPNLHTGSGSDQKVPAPAGSVSATLVMMGTKNFKSFYTDSKILLLISLNPLAYRYVLGIAGHLGGVWTCFVIRQNRSTNQGSVIILEVQIRIFGARSSKFSISKIPDMNILCGNWQKLPLT